MCASFAFSSGRDLEGKCWIVAEFTYNMVDFSIRWDLMAVEYEHTQDFAALDTWEK